MSPTQATVSSSINAYDETPYPSAAFPQTHPNRLAAMGRLFGFKAVSPANARVLELGCADGSNLLPMAEQARGATFLGIDGSKVQIDAGKKASSAAGLKNVELRVQNILDFPASEGKFDYIIAHGIYSWVPEPVRERVLGICATHLAENGIAYISYNALPGWNMRRSLRDMVQFHTAAIKDPKIKAQQTRALVKFLADSVPTENSAYSLLLRGELEMMSKQEDGYLMHELLEEENRSFYFYEFVSQAARHGLQYLSEPNLSQMLASNFPEKVRETLGQVGNNITAQEQYMDFLRNRTFRQTLLCRSSVAIKRNVDATAMKQLAIQSLFKPIDGPIDLSPDVPVDFSTASGLKINTRDSFLKAALHTLSESPAAAFSYEDLLKTARARAHPLLLAGQANRDDTEDAVLRTNLLNLFSKGVIEIHADPVTVRQAVPEKPTVTPLMRYQAMNARFITNLLHQPLPSDSLARYVIVACDGTRTRAGLLDFLLGCVREGKLHVNEGSQRITDMRKVESTLGPMLDNVLKKVAQFGLLVP
jgi:methyltransferase-like protein/2-polyprenyl-3-methyl-5-hydroxy-6-metoxy-1,4-benzoquinol methylase